MLRTLGRAGLLGLPYAEEYGGGGQPLRGLPAGARGARRAPGSSVGVGVSVHTLSCFPLAAYGTDEQRDALAARHARRRAARRLLPVRAAVRLRRRRAATTGGAATATTTSSRHQGVDHPRRRGRLLHADGAHRPTTAPRGISCLLADARHRRAVGRAARSGRWAATASPHRAGRSSTASACPADRLIGAEGAGLRDRAGRAGRGRLGIAACAVGLAQAALDAAVAYARERAAVRPRRSPTFQGIAFMLADMATAGRRRAGALPRRRPAASDAGRPFGTQAAMAKLFATDTAMQVTTDAVQVLGGYGYVEDFPVERYMREAKVLQIVEGTNQIQRMVIGRRPSPPGPRAGPTRGHCARSSGRNAPSGRPVEWAGRTTGRRAHRRRQGAPTLVEDRRRPAPSHRPLARGVTAARIVDHDGRHGHANGVLSTSPVRPGATSATCRAERAPGWRPRRSPTTTSARLPPAASAVESIDADRRSTGQRPRTTRASRSVLSPGTSVRPGRGPWPSSGGGCSAGPRPGRVSSCTRVELLATRWLYEIVNRRQSPEYL